MVTFPDTQERHRWNEKANSAIEYMNQLELEGFAEADNFWNDVDQWDEVTTQLEQGIKEQQSDKMPISDRMLSLYEIAKETDRKV